uniref:Uncharacterized protein n=1 Tax=Leersia perrieri TaxID=77586 RepID=A0A0D9VU28_9ORYZ
MSQRGWWAGETGAGQQRLPLMLARGGVAVGCCGQAVVADSGARCCGCLVPLHRRAGDVVSFSKRVRISWHALRCPRCGIGVGMVMKVEVVLVPVRRA